MDKARQAFRRVKFLQWTTEEAETNGGTRNEKCQESKVLRIKESYDKVYDKVKGEIAAQETWDGGGIEVRDKQGGILSETSSMWMNSTKVKTENCEIIR